MSAARAKDEMRPRLDRVLRVLLPIAVLALGVVLWELVVRVGDIPPYVLPAPRLVFSTLISDWAVLSASLLVTLTTTLEGFLLAAAGGVGLAVLFNQSRLIEYSLYPYAVILQVTPVVAIAPLLLIYLPQQAAVLACAWIVAFFPVLANTTLGLRSVDHNLADLLCGARAGAELPGQAHPHPGALCTGRHHRHRLAHRGRQADGSLGPAGRGGEQARRQWLHRDDRGGQGSA